MAPSRQQRLAEWLAGREPGAAVTLADFEELLRQFAPVSESAMRRLLRQSGAPLEPLAAGVDQDSLATLRDSLLALAAVYESGTPATRRVARRVVITAKDHAKLAAGNQRVDPDKRRIKEEMAAWMLTWLENPEVFPLWVTLRTKQNPY